jgi:hypothetical protein
VNGVDTPTTTVNIGFNDLCQTILIKIKNEVMREVESITMINGPTGVDRQVWPP